MRLVLRRVLFIVVVFCISLGVRAQQDPTSEEELQELAEDLFEEKRYAEAMQRYSQLLSLHPTSAEFNYRYGACLVFAEADKEKSFKHLRFAIGKEGMPDEVHYFLGKAYHLNYQFADALKAYNLYEEKSVDNRKKKYDAQLAIRQCKNGMALLSNIKDITVLSKVETSAKDFFRNYDLSDIGGRVLVVPEELLSKYDLKSGERFLMYFPGNTSVAFFSSYGNDNSTGRDIYRASRLPNGSWSKPVPMKGINTPFNDDFPFLHPDGKTFYFSSEGHNSMGGYDVFKSTYSSADDSFTSPENLDFAVNSPDDDMLYITDQHHELAYFASSRSSNYGDMHVYRVKVSANALHLVLIQGKFIPEAEGVSHAATITVTDAATNRSIGEYHTDPETGEYLIDLPRSGGYKFTVDAEGSELAHNGIVEVPVNNEVIAYSQELLLTRSNAVEKLIIKNNFDEPLDTDLYALAQEILKNRAGLDVNYDASEDENETAPSASGDLASAYHEAGFAKSLSNEDVLQKAEQETAALTQKAKDLKDQRDFSFTLAQRKQAAAAEASADAEDLLRMADAVGDEETSSQYLMESMAGKFAAEKLSEEARVGLALSTALNERLSEVENEQKISATMTAELEQALENEDKEAAIAALQVLKEREVEQSAQPVHETDEVKRLQQQVQLRKKEIEADTRRAQQLRDDENSLALRIKNRKLHLEAAKKKDKDGIKQEIEVLEADLEEMRAELSTLLQSLEPAQQEVVLLEKQVALFEKVQNNQTDTYIPEEQFTAYHPDKIDELQREISEVEDKAAGMEYNLTVVRSILEEETNVAINAFPSQHDLNEFIEKYDLPQPDVPELAENAQPSSEEKIRSEISAARDWINVIDESVETLEEERENTPPGAQRAEIDKKLEEFQQLKYQKVQEIERAEEQLALANEKAAEPFEANAVPQAQVERADASLSETASEEEETSALTSFEYYKSEYQAAAAELNAASNNSEELQEQKSRLAEDYLERVETAIADLQQVRESQRSNTDQQQLIELRAFRDELSVIVASPVAAAEPTAPEDETQVAETAEATEAADETSVPETSPAERSVTMNVPTTVADIPSAESLSYSTIDADYESALRDVKTTISDPRERITQETVLHADLVERIDTLLVHYREISDESTGEDKLFVENAISQLRQIRMLKAREVELNTAQLQQLQHDEFVASNEVILQEVDTAYARKYYEIENSENETYFKTLEKARLEKSLAEQTDLRIAELVQQMDATADLKEKEEIQRIIQQLEEVRVEKQSAAESLFAQADGIRTIDEEEVAVQENQAQQESVAEDIIAPGQKETEQEAKAITSETQSSLLEDELVEQNVTSEEQFVKHVSIWISDQEDIVEDLDEYTVFGGVSDIEYKSLNATLDMEAIADEMKRHNQQMNDFVRTHRDSPLDEQAQEELQRLFENEQAIQERIAQANRRELEFYEVSNEQALEEIAADPSAAPERVDINLAQGSQQKAMELKAEAESLRAQALATRDPEKRLQLQKEAFETEVAAMEHFSKVNTALTYWRKGDGRSFEDEEITAEQVVQRTQPLDEIMPATFTETADETQQVSESPTVETSNREEEIEEAEPIAVQELFEIEGEELNLAIQQHFDLSPEALERVNSEPAYIAWFRNLWIADSLESLRTTRFTEAEEMLDQAEILLTESEQAAAEAEAENDEAERNAAYDRAAALQDEARKLFEMAQRLRNDMGRYSEEAETARNQADSLLATLEPAVAEEFQHLITVPALAEDRAEQELSTPQDQNQGEAPTSEDNTDPVEEAQPEEAVEEEESRPQNEPVRQADETPPGIESPADEMTIPDAPAAEASQPEPEAQPAVNDLIAQGVEEVFETTPQEIYSEENPIPVNVGWPDGLVYAVQVGAFRNPIPQDHFRGFTPVRGEQVGDGITRYSAGLFTQFNSADEAKNAIRQMGYSDAFVVAYLNGERIPLNRALNESEAAEIIADAHQDQQQANQTEIETESPIETQISPESTTEEEQVAPESTPTISPESPTISSGDYYNDPDAAPAVQVERIRGLFFTVQVGVFSNPVAGDQLNNITPLNSERTAQGYIRYTSGRFSSVDFAQDHRELIVNAGITDAFVTAYNNGERISVARASEILEEEGQGVLAEPVQESSPQRPTAEIPDTEPASEAKPSVDPGEDNVANAANFDPEDIKFVVDLGAYGSGMPQSTADAILQIADAGVSRHELPDGTMHYLSKPFDDYEEARLLMIRFREAEVEQVQIRAIALGFLLNLEEARQRKEMD